MSLQTQSRIGKVGRIDLCADLEVAPIVGFTDISKKIHNLHQRAFGHRATGKFGKPQPRNCRKPVTAHGGMGHHILKCGLRHPVHQRVVPCLDPTLNPTGFPRRRIVIGMGDQPIEVIGHRLGFGGKGDGKRLAVQ